MSSFPNSPRLLKAGIVLMDPDTGAISRIVTLQYNPDTLSRTLQIQAVQGGQDGTRVDALRLRGPAVETIKILLGIGDTLQGRLWAYDALEESFRTFKVHRDPQCPACGPDAPPIVIAEYDELCMPHAIAPPPA